MYIQCDSSVVVALKDDFFEISSNAINKHNRRIYLSLFARIFFLGFDVDFWAYPLASNLYQSELAGG